MTRETNPINPQDVINAYRAGEGIKGVAKSLGIGYKRVRSILADAGEPIRDLKAAKRAQFDLLGKKGARWIDVDVDALAAGYAEGASCADLAEEFGISIDTVERRLRPLGIMRPAGVATNREKVARSMQGCETRVGEFEAEVTHMLASLKPTNQLPVGSRNIDIAVHPIAVEVWLSSLRPDNDAYCRERIVEFGDAGWHTAYIYISRRTKTLSPRVAEQIIAWHEIASANPSARREYRVIRGSGELLSRGHVYPERVPLVPAPIDGLDAI